MHNVNLGLLFTANGSSLLLVLKGSFCLFVEGHSFVDIKLGGVGAMLMDDRRIRSARYTLAKAGWYGSPDLELRILFARAHADFKAWAKSKKLYSIQRNFKYGLASWSNASL